MYSQEQINKAMAVDIVDYCEQNGIALQNDSDRYYRMVDHDSLVIDRKKNSFYWNSRGKGGNAINFIQEVEQASFKDAMRKLLDEETSYQDNSKVEYVNEPYEYSSRKEVSKFDKARDYLVEDRKIDAEIVDELHNRGLIKQDRYNNALFLWKDHEQIMGCSEQGTIKSDKYKRGSWKSIQKNSTENYGFAVSYGKPEHLKFFESSIDLLSYSTVNKQKLDNTLLVSMEGLKHMTVFNYLSKATKEMGKLPSSVSLCVDNDKAGQAFVKKLNMTISHKNGGSVDIVSEMPENPKKEIKWDWNDQCKYQHQQKQVAADKKRHALYHSIER